MADHPTRSGAALAGAATDPRPGTARFPADAPLAARLIDVVVVPIVFTVMFANIFGGAVAGGVGNYLQLLVPGVLVSVSVTTSIVTGTQLREDIDSGVFDRIVSMPIARIAPLAGLLIADTARYLIATTVSLAVGLAIGYRPTSPLGVLLGVVLVVFAAFSLSWIFASWVCCCRRSRRSRASRC